MTEYIEIRGARENNLKDITLRIPKRQLYENFSLFVRSFLPKYPPPEADAIENLSMAVIVDQKGGRVVFAGTPTQLLAAGESLTSKYLAPTAGWLATDASASLQIATQSTRWDLLQRGGRRQQERFVA